MTITNEDILGFEKFYRTTLINSAPGFKNLQMVGTCSAHGISNLALFNSVFHVGSNPPLLGMMCRPEGAGNDTLNNIKATGQYTLNNVLEPWYKNAHQTSANFGVSESEFEHCGFQRHYVNGFKAPFVAESNVKIGLELCEITEVMKNNAIIVIGEIKYLILDDRFLAEDGFIDHEKAGTLAGSGLDSYYSTQGLGRLSYPKPGKQPCVINVDQSTLVESGNISNRT